MPCLPPVYVQKLRDQLFIGQLLHVLRRGFSIAIGKTKNSAIGPVMAIRVVMMALVLVVPIDHIHRSLGPLLKIDDLRPAIVEIDWVRRMMTDKSRTFPFERVLVDTGAMDVVHESFAAKF